MIVDPKELTIVGETNFRSMRKKFGIKRDDRRRHVYVIGKSGSGKSVLLENMIMQDIMNGNGCCVMDPHGDLAEAIVKCVPPERQNDIVYFNPSDVDFPIAFNILEGAGSDSSKNLVTSGLIGIFKKIWADSWGPRLEYVLRNTILSLMYAEGSTLLGINRMLVDKKYRNSVLENVHDPILKAFWTQEYENYPAKELPMIISPIQNKVGQFLSNPIVRNILGQAHSTLDLREIMDKKKIFLVNLSKGRIGEDNSSLIGSMIVTKLYLAAMSRVDTSEHERSDFYLYVDEFQNFATDSFADILSEARKYRLALIIAHQYVLQLPEKVADAIFGNGGTLITFRLGPQDAEIFEKEFGPDFVLEDLVNIPKYNVILKLLIDGVASRPFSAATLPPATKVAGYEDRSVAIIAESRKRYARSREFVENQIIEWSMTEDEKRAIEKIKKADEAKKLALENGIPESSVGSKMYSTNCWICGMKMEVPFAPDDKRPIYCIDDLKKIREKLIEEPTENRFKVVKSESSNNDQPKKKDENGRRDDGKKNDKQSQDNRNRNGREQNNGSQNQGDKNKQNNSQKDQNKSQENRNKDGNKQQSQSQNNNGGQNKNNGNNQQKQEVKPQNQAVVINNVIADNKPNEKEIVVDSDINSAETIVQNISPVQEPLKIEQQEVQIKIEQPKELELKPIDNEIKNEDIDFKSILGDVMKETGIDHQYEDTKKQEKEIVKEEVVPEVFEEKIADNLKVEEDIKMSEPNIIESQEVKEVQVLESVTELEKVEAPIEVIKIEEPKEEVLIEPTKPLLSLNQLKEKSFDEIKQELNKSPESANNQSNVLKAGQVIKF